MAAFLQIRRLSWEQARIPGEWEDVVGAGPAAYSRWEKSGLGRCQEQEGFKDSRLPSCPRNLGVDSRSIF